MESRPIILLNTENYPTFCDNRCKNENCKKHISKMRGYYGGAKITKLRNTPDCKGHISKRKQSQKEETKIER